MDARDIYFDARVIQFPTQMEGSAARYPLRTLPRAGTVLTSLTAWWCDVVSCESYDLAFDIRFGSKFGRVARTTPFGHQKLPQ